MPPRMALLEIGGRPFYLSSALVVAVRLGIPDLLRDGPRNIEELAAATGSHLPSLHRLMRALVNARLFAQDRRGLFRLTRFTRCLLTDRADSLEPLTTMASQRWYQQLWGSLGYSVKTGRPAADWILGMSIYRYFEQHPDAAVIFDRAMLAFSSDAVAGTGAVYDFSGTTTLVDVGGGYGQLLALLLKQHRHLRGVLLDLPHVVTRTRAVLESAGVLDRCDIVSGDFFVSVPPGGDVYVLMNVVHNWDDEHAVAILTQCRMAMQPATRLLVIEMMIPRDGTPYFGTLFDLEMLILFQGGRERTEAEFRTLFDAAGLRLARILPADSLSYILECVPRE